MNIHDAMRLLDRKKLPADLKKVVGHASTRAQAEERLRAHLDDPESSPQGDTEEELELDEDTDDDPEDEYDDWTNDELREELEDRGLETSGKKAELIARLREDDAE